jgi:hypothetical protein
MIPTAELEAERLRLEMLHDYEDGLGHSIWSNCTRRAEQRIIPGHAITSRAEQRIIPGHALIYTKSVTAARSRCDWVGVNVLTPF